MAFNIYWQCLCNKSSMRPGILVEESVGGRNQTTSFKLHDNYYGCCYDTKPKTSTGDHLLSILFINECYSLLVFHFVEVHTNTVLLNPSILGLAGKNCGTPHVIL